MNTLIVLLVVVVVVPTVVVVYRNQRKAGHLIAFPIGEAVAWATRNYDRPYGPDSDRIEAELDLLTRGR